LDLLVLSKPLLDWFVLAAYDNLTGPFQNILIGDGWAYQIDYAYNGNNIAVSLMQIPAPTPLALIGLGILVWAGARGRKQGAKTA
jgi:hypothetical protein